MYCIHCGAANADTNKFCMHCGKALGAPGTPPAVTPVPSSPTPAARAPQAQPPRSAPWRRRGLLWAAGALALLLVLGIGTIVLARTWLHLGTNDAVKLMPADSPMVLSISPSLLQVRQLQKLEAVGGAFGAAAQGTGALPTDLLDTQLDIDLEKDVMPWVGLEFAASVVDTGQDELGVLVAAAVRNSGAAKKFTDKVRGQLEADGITFEEETYHNVEIVYQTPDYSGVGLAYAQFNGFLVAGTSLDALHRSVDAAQGRGPALSKDPTYQKVMRQLRGNRAGYFYLDWVRLMGTTLQYEVEDQLLSNGVQGVGASLVLEANGVRLDYALVLDAKKLSQAQLAALRPSASRNRAVAAVPDDVLFVASGYRLEGIFDQLAAFLSPDDTESFDQSIGELEEQLGINLENDLFNWADGEYALALIEDPAGLMGDQSNPLGIALLIETNDRRAAERTMNKIAVNLAAQSGEQFADETIAGSNFRTFTDPYADITLGYGFVGDFVVLGSSRLVLNSLANASGFPLAKDDIFKEASAPLPKKNSGYVYLDMTGLVNLFYRQMSNSDKRDFDRDVRPYIGTVRAVTMATQPAGSKNDTLHGSLFVLFDEGALK